MYEVNKKYSGHRKLNIWFASVIVKLAQKTAI